MVENTWAEPDGYSDFPAPVSYRIFDASTKSVETRTTECTYDYGRGTRYLSFSVKDQAFADAIADVIQRACAYFYQKDDYVPLDGWDGARVTDDEVRARIRRINLGENQREAERSHKRAYAIDELPWDQQRAIIEQIDRIKADWEFELLGVLAGPS